MLAVWIVFAPFAAAFAVYGIGKRVRQQRDFTAIGFTFAELCLSAALLFYAFLYNPGNLHRRTCLHDGRFPGGLQHRDLRYVGGNNTFSEEYFKEEREGLNGYLFFVLITLGRRRASCFQPIS